MPISGCYPEFRPLNNKFGLISWQRTDVAL